MSRGNQRKPLQLPQIDQKQQQQQQKPILISQPPDNTDNYNFITATKKKTVQIKETPPDNYDSVRAKKKILFWGKDVGR